MTTIEDDDNEGTDLPEDDDDDLLEEQEGTGYGEDEGERDSAFGDDEPE